MRAVSDLQAQRDALALIRAQGTLTVRFGDGTLITYKSDAEIAAALADLDRQIAAVSGRARPTRFYFATSKGL